jgi:hypothetical protein
MVQSWSVLSSELAAKGYLSLTVVNLHCAEHGTFQGSAAAADDGQQYCPLCHSPRPATTVGRELCRSMSGWRLVDRPLSVREKAILNRQELEPKSPKPRTCRLRSQRSPSDSPRPPTPKTAERIALCVALCRRGCSRPSIARRLWPEEDVSASQLANRIRIFFFRHKTAIAIELERP